MTTIEDRLRAATRAAAQTVAPDSAPPLRLPGQPSRGPSGRRPRSRRWAGWLAPLAAAAAVTAVIAGSLAISGVFHGHPAGRTQPGPEQIPPYYVALLNTGNGQCCSTGKPYAPKTYAVVRATQTGAVLAMIAPPKPYGTFAGVAAAADDRTFVLAAQRDGRIPRNFRALQRTYPPATRFFLLRINPASKSASGRARLTPLPIAPEPVGFGLTNIALSPLGTSLAVAGNPGEIQVFNLMTGARRTWQEPSLAEFPYFFAAAGNAMLSWQNEHTLAFLYDSSGVRQLHAGADGIRPPDTGAAGVRLLDTRAPGSSLLADSRLIQPRGVIGRGAFWRQILPTADGRTLITVLQVQGTKAFPHLSQELTEFAVPTGKLRVLNRIPVTHLQGNYEAVLWASPSGRVLVVSGSRQVRNPPSASFYATGARVLTPGHSRPIPWSNRTFEAAW